LITIGGVPALELSDGGKQACSMGMVKLMEGLGQQGGIEMIYNELTKDLEIARMKKKRMNGKKKMVDADIIAMDLEIDELAEWLKVIRSYWTFRITDEGKLFCEDGKETNYVGRCCK
jgi:hypothetical protein